MTTEHALIFLVVWVGVMLFMFLLRKAIKGNKVVDDEPIIATLPGNEGTPGSLNTSSPTWAYIRAWAIQSLNEARIANDSQKKSIEETSVIRGEIKLLKRLIALPVKAAKATPPKYSSIERNNFAGY